MVWHAFAGCVEGNGGLGLLVLLAGLPALWGCSMLSQQEEVAGERIVFCVLGDTQALDDGVEKLAKMVAEEKPDFILIPGDCVVANGADPRPWDRFFSIFGPFYTEPNTVLYAIPGNHDMDGGFVAAVLNWRKRWDLPGNELWYSFTKKKSVYVAGLFVTGASLTRSDARIAPLQWPAPLREAVGDTSRTQAEWLQEDLKAVPATVKWKIVFHHEPGSSYASLHDPQDGPPNADVSGLVEPMAFDAGVDLIIRGHQHFYERTYPIDIRTGRRDDARGVTMITSGGGSGGAPHYKLSHANPRWFDAVVLPRKRHYCRVVIEGNKLTWEAVDIDGRIFDRFEIVKRADGTREWTGLPETSRLVPMDGE